RTAPYTGTKALMLAVLEDAIRSYLSPDQRARGEAESWVLSRQRRSVFSFVVVCETLGLEPKAVRAPLRGPRAPPARPGAHPARPPPAAPRPRPAGGPGRVGGGGGGRGGARAGGRPRGGRRLAYVGEDGEATRATRGDGR